MIERVMETIKELTKKEQEAKKIKNTTNNIKKKDNKPTLLQYPLKAEELKSSKLGTAKKPIVQQKETK